MRGLALLWAMALTPALALAQQPQPGAPIIDMHLHALPASYFGPPPASICAERTEFPAMDPRVGPRQIMRCPSPLLSPATDAEMMRATLA